ncbi:nitroreductase family protein [Subtercola lobariae]|uniref:Putative NAD(P)H nitroreductase n=1 Tax=Subtercola lobariae TaxID=1588641 RepID=A0A917B382_9MICO|nr:nitroreductase family protein [Subtercola lobariae]GGF18802.1 NAD(P)H nitroreductase [Subtercola lobariae]
MSAYDALLHRRSHSKVGLRAPSHTELLRLIDAAATVADHSSLRPWRLIALRGEQRDALGQAFANAAAAGGGSAGAGGGGGAWAAAESRGDAAGGAMDVDGPARDKFVAKARRAPLLIAIVASPKPSEKVAEWEQAAVAAGVAHNLTLLLDEAGWGVIWRTGNLTRTEPVRRLHRLAPNEQLLGWLYVGDAPPGREMRRKRPNPADFLTEL